MLAKKKFIRLGIIFVRVEKQELEISHDCSSCKYSICDMGRFDICAYLTVRFYREIIYKPL